ncbi:MAG: hypothetical protein AB7F89_27085, partial [Pirellulaceae bacterium]
GAAGCGLVGRIAPVFTVPPEFHLPDMGPPPEKVAAWQAVQSRVDRWNAMIELACLGGCIAGAVALGESIRRRSVAPLGIALPLGAVAGCVAGVAGSLAVESFDFRSVASVTETVKVQAVMLSILGFGIGAAWGLTTGRPRLAWMSGMAGLAAGFLVGLLYPVVASFVLPSANTAALIPGGLWNRLLWIELAAAAYGALVVATLTSAPRSERPSPP